MVEYDGEVEVADDGTLIYVFEQVLPSAGRPARAGPGRGIRPNRCRR